VQSHTSTASISSPQPGHEIVETNSGTKREAIHRPRSDQAKKVQTRAVGTGCSEGLDDRGSPVPEKVVVESENKMKMQSSTPQ
jgi:hypothetical protein